MTTAADVVNQALQDIAAQATIIGTPGSFTGPNGGSSAAATAANILYTASVQYMLREQDWEFARYQGIALVTGTGAPGVWGYSYIYPSDCVRLRQVYPMVVSANDPQPVTWGVGNVGGPQKSIFTSFAAALATYTTDSVTENQWDLGFQTALVKFLGARFVMAIGGRPDFSEKMAEQAARIGQEGFGRDS